MLPRTSKYDKPRHHRWFALLVALSAMFLFLALCAGCSTLPQPTSPQIQPPPPDLAQPCIAGPEWMPAGTDPNADTTLVEFVQIVMGRETAAAVCRARHRALVQAWPR